MIFAEALTSLDDYREFTSAIPVPVLANLTEFGKTPTLALKDLKQAGVRMALYPLTAFRAMNRAASRTYQAIRRDGNQSAILDELQTREELYQLLRYYEAERRIDLEKTGS
jgi:methylisocitrate lyase